MLRFPSAYLTLAANLRASELCAVFNAGVPSLLLFMYRQALVLLHLSTHTLHINFIHSLPQHQQAYA